MRPFARRLGNRDLRFLAHSRLHCQLPLGNYGSHGTVLSKKKTVRTKSNKKIYFKKHKRARFAMKLLHTLLFILVTSCVVFAQNENAPQVPVVDSTQIYMKLIEQERLNAEGLSGNASGAFAGGLMVGGGTLLLIGGIYLIRSAKDDEEAIDAITSSYFGVSLLIVSIPMCLIGIPIFLYNISMYGVRLEHQNKRDEYQRSLDSYNQRRGTSGSIKMSLFPSLDFFNGGGGLNLLMQF